MKLLPSRKRDVVTLQRAEFQQILDYIAKVELEVVKLRNELIVTFTDEMSPKRREMSNELSRRMEAKLIAEDKARRHTLGEL